MLTAKSIFIFIAAGFCEISGGYLIWLWFKEGKPVGYGLLGALILAAYGVVAALQTSTFGRVYAAYGGVFIICRCCGIGSLTAKFPTSPIPGER